MKKILTFLVMLVACVSILSAQTDVQIPQARFNYQAVVRDWNNSHNLVMGEPVKVTVEIFNGIGSDAVFTEEHNNLETNRNGMVSFIIGENATGVDPFANVNWGIAIIRATFRNEAGDILSVVENPVMAVPYALSANVDPLEISTKAICDYIATAQASSVDSIFDAMLANSALSNQLKTRIVNYVKDEDSLVRALAIYFLGTVTEADVQAAIDTLSDDVKTKIKDLAVAYLESSKGKTVVYDVLKYYLTNTDKNEVKGLWAAARANENFHEIFNAVRDSVIDYIKGHKDLVKSVAMYYMTVIDVEDVQDLHAYLKQNNNGVYTYMINKLGDYLNSYLTNEYMAVKKCQGKDICDLQAEIDALKNNCPKIVEVSMVPSEVSEDFTFSITLNGNIPSNVTSLLDVQKDGVTINPNPSLIKWQQGDNTNEYRIVLPYTGTQQGLVFVLKANPETGCPEDTKTL